MIAPNQCDGLTYAFGKGPSKITVTAPSVGVTTGTTETPKKNDQHLRRTQNCINDPKKMNWTTNRVLCALEFGESSQARVCPVKCYVWV